MEKYFAFDVEDYIVDDFFVRWILNASDEDNIIWNNWLERNPDQVFKVEQAKEIVRSIRFNKVAEVNQSEIDSFIAHLKEEHLSEGAKKPNQFNITKRWLAIAASVVFIFAASLFLLRDDKPEHLTKNIPYTERVNNTESPILIYLPDHTSVILKNGSTLKYPKAFLGSKREVFLTGEAFFEVHKDSKQPFLVHTEEMVTQVVGTSFTIKAYKEAEDFNVQVNTGKVYVYADPRKVDQNNAAKIKPVILTPNEQVTYHRMISGLTKDTLDKPAALSKSVTKHLFNFKGTPVTNVLQVLTKAYKVNIVYDEAAFSTCKLTAKLDDEPLYEKLNIICKAIDANFSIVNGQPVIDGKGCGAEKENLSE